MARSRLQGPRRDTGSCPTTFGAHPLRPWCDTGVGLVTTFSACWRRRDHGLRDRASRQRGGGPRSL